MRTERARVLMNQAMGVETELLDPAGVKALDPADRSHRRRPVPGPRRVPPRPGRDRPPRSGRVGVRVRGDVAGRPRDPAPAGHRAAPRTATGVVGVETAAGPIRAGIVLSAVGGRVTQLAAMARVRLPVRTHPLHAFVTNDFEQGLDKIVASTELACYVSQTERGQMLIGAEFDSQPSFSRISSFDALRSYAYKITMLLPFLRVDADPPDVGRPVRHLGRLEPDHG